MKPSLASYSFLFLSTLNTALSAACNRDNCLRALVGQSTAASPFCSTYTTTANTATTALPTYASACSNLPSRISSACSCLATPATTLTTSTTATTSSSTTTTFVTPPTCSPSTIMDFEVRNGHFDQVFVPLGGSIANMPPWYYRNLNNATGDFRREESSTYSAYGFAAFHLIGQPPRVPLSYGTLSNDITYCSGTTYKLTFAARNVAALTQFCSLTVSLPNYGTVATYPAGYFRTEWQLFGPVTFRPLKFMSSTNPDGTFSDTLDFTVRCEGQPLQPVPAEILFEIDTVDVTINVSNIP